MASINNLEAAVVDIISLLSSAMRSGPWFVVTMASLLIAYEAVRKGRGK